MKNSLQHSISLVLGNHPLLRDVQLSVTVGDDVVLLGGFADTYSKKMLAEEIAEKSSHNKKIINRIEVCHPIPLSDHTIQDEIISRFKTNFGNSYANIGVVVNDGYVRLEGQMKWKYQQQLATDCINDLPGIKGIDNNITVPAAENLVTADAVMQTIKSENFLNTNDIQIDVSGHKVTLKGMVESDAHKIRAERVVRAISGVLEVVNLLCIN